MATKTKAIPSVPTPLLILTALAPEILMRGSPDTEGSLFDHEETDDCKIFTPQIVPDRRIRLYVSRADHAKTRRGKGWKAVLTDLDTGIQFVCRSAPCGLGCHCAAQVVWVWEPAS